MNLKVAIVILNYNGKNWIEKFLPNIIAHNTYVNAEIIIADNASTDASLVFLQEKFSTIRVIQNKKNNGYAGGYNTALKNVDADIYCLLNSDVEVSEYWIENILPIFEDDLVAATQPKILSFYERNKFEYAGAAGGLIDKYGYPFCRGRIFDTIEEDNGQYDKVTEIFWATGACLFVRAKLFHQIGGFDKDFFAHQEEIDLCWRLKNLGYKIMYAPQSKVYHVGGGTLNKSNPQKTFLNYRNNRFLLIKNLNNIAYQKIVFIRNLLDFVALCMTLLKGNFNEAKAIYNALKIFNNQKQKYITKRENNERFINLNAVAKSNRNGIYKNSIIWNYYAKGKKYFSEIQDKI